MFKYLGKLNLVAFLGLCLDSVDHVLDHAGVEVDESGGIGPEQHLQVGFGLLVFDLKTLIQLGLCVVVLVNCTFQLLHVELFGNF